jgi:integrase
MPASAPTAFVLENGQLLNQKRRKTVIPQAREPRSQVSTPLGNSGHLENLSPKYLNDLLGYMRSFVHWCMRRRLIEADPLRNIQNVVVKQGRGHRRAFTHSELRRFLTVVPPHRAAVYKVAYYLGLRRWELNRLKRGDFDLDGIPPVVRIPGTITKNRKSAVLDLHRDLLPTLRTFFSLEMSPFEYAFHGRVPNMATWRRDLTKAEICREDPEGRRFDFHSLRHTLCTHLRIAGVTKRDAMAIMRLSSERLLDHVYCDDSQLRVGSEIAKLPSFTSTREHGIV